MEPDINLDALQIIEGASWFGLGTALGLILEYIAQGLIAARLGPSDYGVFSVGIQIFSFGVVLALLALPSAVTRFIPRLEIADKSSRISRILTTSLFINLISSVLAGTILFLLSTPIAEHMFAEPRLTSVLQLFALAVPSSTLVALVAGSLRGLKLSQQASLLTSTYERALRLGFMITFLLLGLELRGIVIAYLPASVLAGSLGVRFLHLLIFSAGYVLWQTLFRKQTEPGQSQGNPPGYLTVLIVALALAVVTGVVRIWYPIDKWVYLLGFIRVAFADVPRDLSFFIIGVLAYDRQWFQKFSARDGYVWLGIGVILAGFWYAYSLLLWKFLPTSGITMDILRLIWEMLLCFGMCIGLTVLFREKFNLQGRIGKAMAQSQYGAYIFHVLFVLLFQFLVISIAMPPFAKFIVATLAAVPTTFLFSYWVRKPLHL